MRIEKVNENQIRCFLSKEEMESRQLHLKELAYGTDKAKALFHELMQEAYSRFGFQAENMPVMIEAVPQFDDSLVLIVTKVDNPEELDTRFSSFAPMVKNDAADADMPVSSALGQLLETIRQGLGDDASEGTEKKTDAGGTHGTGFDSGATEGSSSGGVSGRKPVSGKAGKGSGKRSGEGSGGPSEKDTADRKNQEDPAGTRGAAGRPSGEKKTDGRNSSRIPVTSGKAASLPSGGRQLFTFPTLGKASEAAVMAAPGFEGSSALYRDPADGKYYLFVSPGENAPARDVSRLLSTLSEFGSSSYITPAREQYLLEHCEVLCAWNALQKLAELRMD